MLHPAVHLEIARQRHQELLAEASRYRLARSCHNRAASWLPRRWQRALRRSPALQQGGRPSMDLEIGLDM
jgi:hypothetical protein